MKELLEQIRIKVSENLYLKDPESSQLGQRFLYTAIRQIHELGLEKFTFKKLADECNTSEASVYRYFENKHKMLTYLVSWHWGLMEYRMVFATANISSPEEKLKQAIRVICSPVEKEITFQYIDFEKLNDIIVSESMKAFLTKDVEEGSRDGYFEGYRRLCDRLARIMLEIKPGFEHPHTLASTIMEGAHLQNYFSRHLPYLTDIKPGSDGTFDYFSWLVFNAISK